MYDSLREILMQYLTLTLIGVMIIAGLFGGVINYYLSADDPIAESGSRKATLKKSIALGVGASFLVPLFLNMISSNLLALSKQDASKLLVFAGFCLIASISSKAFITSISERILRDVKEAKREAAEAKKEVQAVQPKVDALVTKETKVDPSSSTEALHDKEIETTLSDAELKVLKTLADPKYTFRFMFGIAHDSGIAPDEVDRILSELNRKALVAETIDKKERKLFYLTREGRALVAQLTSAT